MLIILLVTSDHGIFSNACVHVATADVFIFKNMRLPDI